MSQTSLSMSMLVAAILVSCNGQPKAAEAARGLHGTAFSSCFADADISTAGQSIGCMGGVWKRISPKYVVHVLPPGAIQLDRCDAITIQRSDQELVAELLVFDNSDANLTNTCADLVIENAAAPSRRLPAREGKLLIGFSDPSELYGHPTQRTSVLIKNVVFIDDTTGTAIELELELLWKVLDLGTPG